MQGRAVHPRTPEHSRVILRKFHPQSRNLEFILHFMDVFIKSLMCDTVKTIMMKQREGEKRARRKLNIVRLTLNYGSPKKWIMIILTWQAV